MGGLTIIAVSLLTITLVILWKEWKKVSLFEAILILVLTLFTIPFPQNTEMYSVQIIIPQQGLSFLKNPSESDYFCVR